ncbi:MAG: hypothetical protein OEV49_09860 [candidate division Zixibacteria bacterium]|nr:hypothetical protein [candidate division Zixibacteria bacterium]MDH3938442.1 hypothetical protein [candidate division Zixibacteria bacterium]MDH4034755.1 hypothetical protein [candidate division Zixibacteria bacterium]
MDILWQQVIIVAALVAAGAYLIRRAIRRPDRKAVCTRCRCKKNDVLDRGDLRRL